MKVKTILSQHCRDFTAILECEHCSYEQVLEDGYDDSFYHSHVIPNILCKSCGKKACENYRPLTTKYSDSETV